MYTITFKTTKSFINKTLSFTILLFTAFILNGCSSYLPPKPDIQSKLYGGASFIITPKYFDVITILENVNDKNIYFDIKNEFDISDDFIVMSIPPGEYFISRVFFSTAVSYSTTKIYGPKKNYVKFHSILNDTELYKTPEQKVTWTKVYNEKTKEYEFEPGLSDMRSYYEMYYFFDKQGDNAVAKIKIEEEDILVIPSIWIDIEYKDNSCNVIDLDQSKEEDIMKLINEKRKLASVIYDWFLYENGIYTWGWFCRTNSITINIDKPKLEDFTNYVDKEKFDNVFLQRVTFKDYEYLDIFKRAKEVETFDEDKKKFVIPAN